VVSDSPLRGSIRLTESELNQIIKQATAKVMNEMDAATNSRIHNASHRAMQDIQNGNYERTVNGRDFVNNDDIISRADSLEQNEQAHWLKDYVGQTFKFFGRSQMGLLAHVLFTFEKMT
jgi:hypothetical protein